MQPQKNPSNSSDPLNRGSAVDGFEYFSNKLKTKAFTSWTWTQAFCLLSSVSTALGRHDRYKVLQVTRQSSVIWRWWQQLKWLNKRPGAHERGLTDWSGGGKEHGKKHQTSSSARECVRVGVFDPGVFISYRACEGACVLFLHHDVKDLSSAKLNSLLILFCITSCHVTPV